MLTILCIDDEAFIRGILKKCLVDMGHRPLVAENGIQAKEIIAKNVIDVVICDLQMPEMNGYEFFEYLSQKYPKIPFIVLSGHSHRGDKEYFKNLYTVKDFLPKPLNQERLKALLDSVSEEKKSLPKKKVITFD